MVRVEKLKEIETRWVELETLLADPQVMQDSGQYQKFAKEYAEITPIVTHYRQFQKIQSQKQELESVLKEKADADLVEIAQSEWQDVSQKEKDVLAALEDLLNPKVQEKDRNLIVEIRAGTGGEEAALFAADLYRMYCKYADKNGWKVEQISNNPSDNGGFKEVIFSISGKGASKRLQWESGAHRVQRVPATEASGRIHTSAATVAILLEPEEVDIQIEPKDLKIDVYRSSGPGGQSVNTTDSAVRITHIPTGTVVACQDERSQLKNKMKAMRVLRARIQDKIQQETQAKESQDRKLKIGSGDRSEKIRTYNFPDHRITDHRIGFTTHKLPMVLDGEMDDLTNALVEAALQERLK